MAIRLLALSLIAATSVLAQGAPPGADAPRREPPPWSISATANIAHQGRTDLDAGGDVAVTQVGAQVGASRRLGMRQSVGINLGMVHHQYRFSDTSALGGTEEPWEDVQSTSIGFPMRLSTTNNWSLMLIPSLRTSAESGASQDDAFTGGAIVGTAYRFSDRLTLGPGFGAFSAIEDDFSFFPFLLIDWDITERLSLSTGRGQGASGGPGLSLGWAATPNWNLGLAGRYESLRFRLDEDGPAPEGVGEDSSVALMGFLNRSFGRRLTAGASLGLEMARELELEDAAGRRVAKDDADPTFVAGLTLTAR